MKPKNWKNCPNAILEPFLWNLELNYDSYESSKAETIHQITCDPDSANDYNLGLIKGSWDAMTEEGFRNQAVSVMESLQNQIDNIKTFLS